MTYHFPYYVLHDAILELYQNPRFAEHTVHEYRETYDWSDRVYVEMNHGEFWRSIMVC